jgi:hypothetical protein
MTQLTIHEVFDLPSDIPRCIVKIQDFDDPEVLRENIRDYVITETVADEMERLVDRIVASAVRHEAGEGHYLHGSFGSGKSHFMAILGLILENNPAVWEKDHPAIRRIQDEHGEWLAQHSILVVPVYMLGQERGLQVACYNAANARLARLDVPPCEFSEADKVIDSFRAEAERYGKVVFERFEDETAISQRRFERMTTGEQSDRDSLAHLILEYRDPSQTERVHLYPDKFSDGMAKLTRHAKAHGFAGVVYLIDELILYLTGKKGREYVDEFNNLVALADNSATDRAAPLWVLVAKQRNIQDTVPDDTSQQHVYETMEHHKDRFPETTDLADTELAPIVQKRVLKVRPTMETPLERAMEETLGSLSEEVRSTLLHDLMPEEFRQLYPFHPALIRTLIDVTARLSRDRAAIRLLYELLIKHYADLPVGSIIPYAALFDVVFLPTKLTGGANNEELNAVRETYYDRLDPLVEEMYDGEPAERARLVVKTALLCGLSKSMRGDITVERILHLNYQDLRGRTAFGSYQSIARILTDLDNRTELVHFNQNPANPALGIVEITLASGVQLSDVLKRVSINWRQRLEVYFDLMKDCLGKTITNGAIPNYEHVWRGTGRRGRVKLTNVAELTNDDMRVADDHELTLFIDYPFNLTEATTRANDLEVIERARQSVPRLPIGFWLPAEFTPDDIRDLDEYTKMAELQARPEQYLQEYGKTQRDDVLTKLVGQRRTKGQTLRKRLVEVYRGPDVVITFLDPAVTPVLDVDTLDKALDRITDTVCDRRYPHHPHFHTELNQRILKRLLDDFLVPAALGGGSVPRNPDLDGLLRRLGEPLELAEEGAQTWTLRPQSRYLSKLDELATGKRVESDKILRGLVEAFGFTQDLSEMFVLYLIRGQGYRALRNGQSVTDVDFGGIRGLILERGSRLAIHEWAQVKDLAREAWDVHPHATELTVAAQDRLWRQLNAAASKTRTLFQQTRHRLVEVLGITEVNLESADRLAVLDAAQALNTQAVREDLDSYDGLLALLTWEPEQKAVSRDAAVKQISRLDQTGNALKNLETGMLNRIVGLADSGNAEAKALLERVQGFLADTDEASDLYSHVISWQDDANAIIDKALTSSQTPTPTPTLRDRPRDRDLYVSEARLSIGPQTAALDSEGIELIEQLLDRSGLELEGEMDVLLHIFLKARE